MAWITVTDASGGEHLINTAHIVQLSSKGGAVNQIELDNGMAVSIKVGEDWDDIWAEIEASG